MRGSKTRESGYLAYHLPRYEFLLRTIGPFIPPANQAVLDIGRSAFTDLLHERYHCRVDSLGLQTDGATPTGIHYHFDLNDARREATWRQDVPRYSLIIMAEVIEHLHTAPTMVLRFVSSLMEPNGVLILQTPNAVSLPKRCKIMIGKNPFDLIREDITMPGHFREYTLNEMKAIARECGLEVHAHWFRHYFDSRYSHHRLPSDRPHMIVGTLKNLVGRILPPGLRQGVTLVMTKRDQINTQAIGA